MRVSASSGAPLFRSLRSMPAAAPSLAFLLFVVSISAQSVIDFSALPACTQQCSLLLQAQTVCLPPAAPVTDQQTYLGCFCRSAYLTTLYNTPLGICDGFCPPDALPVIQQWYVGTCQALQPGSSAPVPDPTAPPPGLDAAPLPGPDAAPQPAVPPNSIATESPVSNRVGQNRSQPKSWIDGHWQWVLFVVLLILAMVLFSVLGVWIKRRYRRKRDLERASVAAGAVARGNNAFVPTGGTTSRASVIPEVSQRHLVAVPSPGPWGSHQSRPQSRAWSPDPSDVIRAGSSQTALAEHRYSNSGSPVKSVTGGAAEEPQYPQMLHGGSKLRP